MSLLRIAAIDDQPKNIATLVDVIEELLEAEAVVLPADRIPATPDLVTAWVRDCGIDAVLIDQDLHKGNYSPFKGMVIAAALYKQRTPTVLTTMYSSETLKDGIWYRRYLPAFLPKNHLYELEGAMQAARDEVAGQIPAEREAFRTVVRVDQVIDRECTLVISAYDTGEGIWVSTDELTRRLQRTPKAGMRFMAEVNIGAKGPGDLFISEVQF